MTLSDILNSSSEQIAKFTLKEIMGKIPILIAHLVNSNSMLAVDKYQYDISECKELVEGYKFASLLEYGPGYRKYILTTQSDIYDQFNIDSNTTRGINISSSLTDSIRVLSKNFSSVNLDDVHQSNLSYLNYLRYDKTNYDSLKSMCSKVKDKIWGISKGEVKFFDRVIPENSKFNQESEEIKSIIFNTQSASDTDIESESTEFNSGFNFRSQTSILPVTNAAKDYVNIDEVRSIYQYRNKGPICIVNYEVRFDRSSFPDRYYNLGDLIQFITVPQLVNIPFRLTSVARTVDCTSELEVYRLVATSWNDDFIYTSKS